MKRSKIKELHEIYLFIGAVFVGVVLYTLIFLYFKSEIISSNVNVDFHFSNEPLFETSLYYSYGNSFDPRQRIEGKILGSNTIRFHLPRNDSLITNFRLDFNNDSRDSPIIIDSLVISYGIGKKVLSKDQIFDHIFLNSGAVNLDVRIKNIGFNKNATPYDPYIIFDPLLHIILNDHPLKWTALFFPFAIVLLILLKDRLRDFNMSTADFLFFAFIVSIPLKIAWTTFTAILICIWGLYKSLARFGFNFKNPNGLFLLSLFLVLLIFGRPLELKMIDHQLALLIFYLIICSNILQRRSVTKYYVYVFLFLNAVLITLAIGFLISFENIFGLEVSGYFKDIKIYSGNIRDWLYYDHAAFLSFFAMMVLPLMDETPQFNRKTKIFWIYNIFILLTIILMGARISFLIYSVILLNLFLKRNYKWSISFNTLLFAIIATFFFVKIDKLDQNRYELWKVSWEAIKERPFFGYGLGSSDNILHDSEMIKRTGIKIPLILNHSHNQFLTLWLELGLSGIMSILVILGIYLKRTEQYKSKPMILFIFGTSYVFLTESVLQTSKPFFVLCFLFALISLSINYKNKDQQQPNEI